MNQNLQNILDIIQQNGILSEDEKNTILKSLQDADKELMINAFKLERTEKVKKTTAILLEETIEELEQKRKAVEAQNRELEIEASLERVRTVAMGMNKSDDLLSICEVSFKEFKKLGFDNLRNAIINILNDEKGFFLDYDYSDYLGGSINNINYNSHPVVEDYLRQIKRADDAFAQVVIESTELDSWKEFRRIGGQVDDPKLDETQSLYYYLFSIGVGDIGISTFIPIDDTQIKILKRFRNVFDLAYRRYNDIALAEVQAREAQIELALERVRARTMAMQSSNELKEVVLNMFDGLKSLGVDPTVCNISLMDKKTCDSDVWSAHQTDNGLITYRVFISHFEHPFRKKLIDSFLNKISFSVHELSGDLKKSYIQYLIDHVDYSKVPDEVTKSNEKLVNIEEGIVLSAAYMKYGLLIVSRSHAISNDESDILQRFAKIFEQTYTRFLDLQKAEAQAREAQIELALERVRARAMAMQKSDELLEVGALLYQGLFKLGIQNLTCGYVLMDQEKKIGWNYGVNPGDGTIKPQPTGIPQSGTKILQLITESWEKQEPCLLFKLDSQETINHQTYIAENCINFPFSAEKLLSISPERLVIHTFNFKQGYLLIVGGIVLTTQQQEMVIRFAKVFEQTYTRFLDLQKAEAQTREAQIEASLEKVRAHTMGMQSSDDLSNVASVMFDQMKNLGGDLFAFGIVLCDKQKNVVEQWHNLGNEGMMSPFSVPVDLDYIHRYRYDQWKAGEELFSIEIPEDYIAQHFELMFELPSVKAAMDEVAAQGIEVEIPNWEIDYGASFKHGYLLVSSREPFKEDHIFPRFAKVFDQAYTRFLDLKKAEAQAREAQIEASLEKVRSVALTLKKSDEMLDITEVLYEQLIDLGFNNIRNAIIDIHNDKNETFLDYDYSHDMGRSVTLMSYYDDPIIEKQVRQIESSSDAFFEIILEGQDLQDLIDIRLKNGEAEDPRLRQIAQLTYNLYSFGNGAIGISNFGLLSDEQKLVLKRFRNVFAFAYKRYTDMVSAETQAREAKKQASLDRIRAEIASMRTSEDLNKITPIIWRELKNLEVPFIRCGVFIVDEENKDVQVYLTTPNGKSLAALNLSFDANELTSNTVDHWRKKQVLKEHWNKKEFINWTKSMIELGQVQNSETYQGSTIPPESLDLHFVPFTQGMLYVGDVNPLTDEKLDLVKTLANAFSIAYARYEDFKNLEDAKNKIEFTLKELKSAQVQLIHSEKMASLGELTAGIAHEIKNPLNFVNNFSEVSRELLDEMKVEIQNNNLEEVIELVEDLKQNLEKINQHGKRADSIVKGMLLHSRGSSGEKTLTDINDLLDQYVNLAYHGMRAQNKEFNISIEKDYDKTLEKINVIPQDLSRVFLNIINNACYAAYDKKKKNSDNNFSPTLSVSTKNLKDNVEIRISDNGNGIPKDILDKIFQPFFTTKPTGEGTGLGLSLSYDIITKMHGGELKVESEKGKHTELIIDLPKQ